MLMSFNSFRYVLVVVLSLFACAGASAQTMLNDVTNSVDESTDPTASANFEETLREAVKSGVSVVVIDPDGKLLGQSEAPVKAAPEDTLDQDVGSLMKIQSDVDAFRDTLERKLNALPVAFNEVAYILRATSPDGRIMTFVEVLFYSLALFALGALVEREIFGKRIAKGLVVSRVKSNPQGYSEKLPFLVFRFFMGVVGVLVSMAVAYVVGTLIFGKLHDTAMQFTVAVIYAAYFASRVVALIWRMVLSPYLSQYRIPLFTDRDAKRLHNWLWILAVVDIWSLNFSVWISELGLNHDVFAVMASCLSLLLLVMNVLMVLINRSAITHALLRGKDISQVLGATRFVARAWAPVSILYFLIAWMKLTYELVLELPSTIPLIAGAYGILMSIIVVFGAINYFIEKFFERARAVRTLNEESVSSFDELTEEQKEALNSEPQTMKFTGMHSFEDLAQRVAGILALVAGFWAFVSIWDVKSDMVEESALSRMIDVIAILFIGYVVYHVFRIWIDSKIAEEVGEEADAVLGDEGMHSSASRLATLLPLFRNFILIVVVVTVALIVLLELGVNVSPLFAGAGVVGLAVGFGSQALVKDVFSGAFFLFDDAFRKGEYIDIGDVKGTVEKISVRSFQLRHHRGLLHTVPFGEIRYLTNFSRDWVIMKLPLRVTYDTDVEKVRKLIKKLGERLLEDPVIGKDFLQPLKSQGVIEMQDSAMIIRVKFMTTPGEQWMIRKRVFEEIRSLFEAEGIKFAHREVTVRLADGKVDDLSDKEKDTVLAAAQSAIEDADLQEAAGGGNEDDR
jgi:small-conductance mechanosensitive channel